MDKIIVAIGGGEIKSKETLAIDEYIAGLAKARAGEKRATALFVGTASHDSMPYFNSFRKTYTSVFDIKAEVALTVYGENDEANLRAKFEKADMIYVGGGDTLFMLEHWKKSGLYEMISDAYERGVIVCGLSAGAVCWFDKAYSDYDIMRGVAGEYKIMDGMGILRGVACPHYDERAEFDEVAKGFPLCYAMQNKSAVVFVNGAPSRSISAGGKSYIFNGGEKTEL